MPPISFLLFAVTVSTILSAVGLIVNLFIAVVNFKTWVKNHRISSSDRILFSLGITRFLTLGLFLLNSIYFISPHAEKPVYLATFSMLCWMFLDSNSLWFVTLLNALYCVKITNFHYSVFLLLKRNLSAKIPRLLLACVLSSAFTTLLCVVLRQTASFPVFVTGINGTAFHISEGVLYLMTTLVLNSFLQFIINLTSASLLIYSLRRHIQKMQQNATGFWNPQTEAHLGAMKLMIFFLILYIPYSVATMLYYLSFSAEMNLRIRSMCAIISTFYTPGHSVLIILSHPKLKTKAMKILCFNK